MISDSGATILRHLTLIVSPPSNGLQGPNSAGKTTIIHLMPDILKPDCGDVALFGRPLDGAAGPRFGYVREGRGLYRDLKREPTLVYLTILKGLDAAAATGANGA